MATRTTTKNAAPGSTRRRRGWRAFLTPGWVITAVIVVMFAYVAFTVLAPWQLGKNTRTQENNQRLSAAMDADPVPVEDVLPADGSPAGADREWTRVTLRGRFIPDAQVLLRNRPVDTSPAFQVLTAFRLDSGGTVLVNRGWTPPRNAADVPDIPTAPTGDRTVEGYVRPGEQTPSTPPLRSEGVQQVYGISTAQIGDLVAPDLSAAGAGAGSPSGRPLAADYVQLGEGSVADPLHPIPLPKLDSGPYLSYGIQWIAFGVMAPLGLGYFVWAEMRERRREREARDGGPVVAVPAAGSGGGSGSGDRAGAGHGPHPGSGSGAVPVGEGTTPPSAASADPADPSPGDGHAGHSRTADGRPGQGSPERGRTGDGQPDAGRTGQPEEGREDAARARERKLAERYGRSHTRFFDRRNARDEERF
ncbi:SURF1 family cytochrome oxidase biogenesis protein [Corynebacterium bovis]|uniref:SURF1 family cytochrome oxidase biogenesis protein n=1 Tax=Corynebacterium bovis TaxID=36808 RepID=UPI00244B8968|nr:SURF1 family cytochrome oxidase biogenesis protein [Corynebacterium bovis]MDH2456015.1 SURF1 family cytochrome oxidase biogenesis protein [Corynebacterium bovis]